MLAIIIMKNTSGRTILITVKVAVEEDRELVNMKDGESGHRQLVEPWRRGNG